MKTQGVFINICSYYWSQECEISFEKLLKRFKIHKKQIENLKKAKIIFSENENLVIKFLDKQWTEREAVKLRNQQNGKAGGRPKLTQSVKSGLAKANPSETNIEEKREEENIKSKPKNISQRADAFCELLQTKWLGLGGDQYLMTSEKIKFFDFWTEHGDNDRKMKFEKQKSFDVSKRLATWKGNNFNNNQKPQQREIGDFL